MMLMPSRVDSCTSHCHDTMMCCFADDQCYGMIKWKQAAMGLQDFGLTLRNPDFVKLAEVCSACREYGSFLWKGSRPTYCRTICI